MDLLACALSVMLCAPHPAAPHAAPKVPLKLAPPPRFAFEVTGANAPRGLVALTFDDGPHRTLTPALLELLAKHHVRATFFMLGQNAKVLPGVAAMVAGAGHEVGAHSMDHHKLTGLPDEKLRWQVEDSQKLVGEAIGRPVPFFRAPYGSRDARVVRLIEHLNMRHILWSIDSRDWQDHNPRTVVERIMAGILRDHRGIVLMHDIHPTSIQAAALLLDALEPLRRTGEVRLVTVGELMGLPAVHADSRTPAW